MGGNRQVPMIGIVAMVIAVFLATACAGDDVAEGANDPRTDTSDGEVDTTDAPAGPTTTRPSDVATVDEISNDDGGSPVVVDDAGFHPSTLVVQDSNCDFGCSAVFDVVNQGTTTHTFTIDDSHFPADWLEGYGSVDWEIEPGQTANGVYVSYLPGSSDDRNPETLEFYCRHHPELRGSFVRG